MKEITTKDIMHIGFLKKERFTGSNEGMRYRMEKHEYEEESDSEQEGDSGKKITELLVSVWPEPYAYDHTPSEEIQQKSFSFDEEGVEAGRRWLNEMCENIAWDQRRLV